MRVKYRHLICRHGFICGQTVIFIHLSNLFAFSHEQEGNLKCTTISRNMMISVTRLFTLKHIVNGFHAN